MLGLLRVDFNFVFKILTYSVTLLNGCFWGNNNIKRLQATFNHDKSHEQMKIKREIKLYPCWY